RPARPQRLSGLAVSAATPVGQTEARRSTHVIHNKDGAGIQTVEYAGSEAGVAERQQESLYGTLDTEVTETPQLDLIVVDSITSTCTETGLEPHTRLDENHISENCRSLMKNSRKSTSSVISFTVTGLMNSNLSFNSSLDS
ncbi:MAG: hypothetical protein ACK6D6_18170, partial [Planctomyces sp.]